MNYDLFLEKLKEANLSKKDFIEKTGITDNLLKGWATQRQGRKTQPWVKSWLELYIKNKRNDEIILLIKENSKNQLLLIEDYENA